MAAFRKRPEASCALSARGSSWSAAWTVMPLVSPGSTRLLRRTVAPSMAYTAAVCCTPSTAPMRAPAVSGSLLSSPKNDSPACSVSRFVPRRSMVASRSAWLDAEMPSTATIEAIPIATPTADSAARRRRVRRPMLPTARTSRGKSRLGSNAAAPGRAVGAPRPRPPPPGRAVGAPRPPPPPPGRAVGAPRPPPTPPGRAAGAPRPPPPGRAVGTPRPPPPGRAAVARRRSRPRRGLTRPPAHRGRSRRRAARRGAGTRWRPAGRG